jgi:hypothetical protein
VESAQRYDLDRVYHGETSGWQLLEEFEPCEHQVVSVWGGLVLEGGLEAEKGAEAPVAKASRRTGN